MSDVSIDLQRLAPGMVNALCPVPGVATGGQPTARELQALADAGVRTVLDTRLPHEPRGYDEPAAVARAGLEYIVLPMGNAPPDDDLFDRVREILSDAGRRPVLVHCASGNRVGMALIPWLMLDEGMETRDAVSLAMRMGMRTPQLAQYALAYVERTLNKEK